MNMPHIYILFLTWWPCFSSDTFSIILVTKLIVMIHKIRENRFAAKIIVIGFITKHACMCHTGMKVPPPDV